MSLSQNYERHRIKLFDLATDEHKDKKKRNLFRPQKICMKLKQNAKQTKNDNQTTVE